MTQFPASANRSVLCGAIISIGISLVQHSFESQVLWIQRFLTFTHAFVDDAVRGENTAAVSPLTQYLFSGDSLPQICSYFVLPPDFKSFRCLNSCISSLSLGCGRRAQEEAYLPQVHVPRSGPGPAPRHEQRAAHGALPLQDQVREKIEMVQHIL